MKYDIIVRGGYGLTNFGDDALLKSIHEDYFSQFNPKELGYSCQEAEYLTKYIPGYDVISRDANYGKLTKVLVYGGGTQFYSFIKGSILTTLKNNKKNLFNPRWIANKILNRFKKPVESQEIDCKKIALGIGIGPFLPEGDPKDERDAKRLFQSMDFVAVRDNYSYQKCKEWGLKNVGQYTDLCYKMNHPLFFQENKSNKANKIGILVRDWEWTLKGNSYRDSLIQYTDQLKEKGKEVHFFVFAKGKDKNWINFLKEQGIQFNIWNPDSNDFDNYLAQLAEMDLFISARYHGAIFASMLGKPFISIEVEQKLRMISNIFKEGSANWSYPFDIQDLDTKFESIDQDYSNHAEAIRSAALQQKDLANQMCTDLHKNINNIL